jgi:hypothetical protein
LASILNEDFFTSTTNEFSLYQIYNELYLKFKDLNSNSSLSSNSNIDISNKKNISSIPFMCGTFKSEIIKFKELYDGNDIYENINKLVFNGEKTRDQIKDGIMNFLNQSDFRKKSVFISKMKKHFPKINDFIETIQKFDQHKSCSALLLQRVESYLLLKVGAKELLNKIPEISFFTIHDSVVVEESRSQEVMEILQTVISEKTGVQIQFKLKQQGKGV